MEPRFDGKLLAEIEGARDFYEDRELSDNPYRKDTIKYRAWKKGFLGSFEKHIEDQG